LIRIRSFIKPGDYWIIAILIAATVISWFLVTNQARGSRAIVYADGRESAIIDLAKNSRVEVQGPLGCSVVQCKEGRLKMIASPCPNQVCVRMGEISRRGSTIVCVPNHILIRIAGRAYEDLDGMTQ
jgi:hypothetical protein